MKIAVLENIRSCHNVGAIFRTADGAGFDQIILAGYSPPPPDRRIEKVSLGAENTIEWRQIKCLPSFLQRQKNKGFQIWALEKTPKSQNLFQIPPQKIPQNLVLILGNEVDGVCQKTLRHCHHHAHIPMMGAKESLNVSVAAGIGFYHFLPPG